MMIGSNSHTKGPKMADISKCEGTNCPLKEKCYRYTVKADPLWQSWFSTVPTVENGICMEFWEDESK